MKRLTNNNLGFALQIFAVILLFGYPGCASNKEPKQFHTGKTALTTEKKSAVEANSNNVKPAVDLLNNLHQWEQDVTKFSFVAWPYK